MINVSVNVRTRLKKFDENGEPLETIESEWREVPLESLPEQMQREVLKHGDD